MGKKNHIKPHKNNLGRRGGQDAQTSGGQDGKDWVTRDLREKNSALSGKKNPNNQKK